MIKFKKMNIDKFSKARTECYYLLNMNDEIILRTKNYERVKEKKKRLDYIARVKGTFTPRKFRITDSGMNILN
jgi:hypothetical protein